MPSSAMRLRLACVAIGVIVAAFLFVYPTKSLLAQQRTVDNSRNELSSLQRENAELQLRVKRLALPSEIERVARSEYGMVRPNEQAFAVVPKAKPKPTTK